MPVNKLALLRYKIIDQCLQNRQRKWTLENLIEKVSDALYEYEGIDSGISKRTIQLDIQTMRSDKLGYFAPIIVEDRKFYTYEDRDYCITNANVSKADLEKLGEIIKLLNQFKGFNYFEDLSALVGKLEDKIHKQKKEPVSYFQFEKNELLKGLKWIDPLLEAIKEKMVLELSYQSFKARKPSPIEVHPYLLKEYRNRWFLLCRNHRSGQIILSALDRIEDVQKKPEIYFRDPEEIDIPHYFDDVIGVTKSPGQKTSKIILKINRYNAPYVLTKPLHPSQKLLKRDQEGIILEIEVIWNFELEREILGFGEALEVLSPRSIKNRIQKRLQLAIEQYQKTNDS